MLGPQSDRYDMITDQLGDQLLEILKKAPPFIGVKIAHQWDDTGKIAIIRLEFITEMTDELLDKIRQG